VKDAWLAVVSNSDLKTIAVGPFSSEEKAKAFKVTVEERKPLWTVLPMQLTSVTDFVNTMRWMKA
jgi:hypothetical protein